MNEKKLGDFADILGTILATTCVAVTLPELLENLSYLSIFGYTFGVFVLTTKINRIIRNR